MSVQDVYRMLDSRSNINLTVKKPKEVYDRLDKMYEQMIEFKKKNKWDEAYCMGKRWFICVEWLKKQKTVDKQSQTKYYSQKRQYEVQRLFTEIKLKIESDFAKRQKELQNESNPSSKTSNSQSDDDVDLELQLPDVPTDEPEPKNENEITCLELRSIMFNEERREKGVLIFDLREPEDFVTGKMAFQDFMINIPESKIIAKKPASYYQSLMDNDASARQFEKRGDNYLLVLVDWDCYPPKKLKTPILNFRKFLEQDKNTSNKRIATLLGGFDEWLKQYPDLVVRPAKKPSPQVINMDKQDEIKKDIENNFGFDFPASPNPSMNAQSPILSTKTPGVRTLPFSTPNPQVMSNNSINATIFNDFTPYTKDIQSITPTVPTAPIPNQIKNNAINSTYNASLVYNNRMSDEPMLPFTSQNQQIIPNPINPSVRRSDISNSIYNNETPLPHPASAPPPMTNQGYYPTLNGAPRMRDAKVVIEKLPPSKPTVDRSSKPVPGRKLSSDNSQIDKIEKDLQDTRIVIARYEKTLERTGRLDDWTKEQYDIYKKKEEELSKELEKLKSQGPSAPKNGKLYPDLTNNLSGLALNNKPRSTRPTKPDTRNEDKENIQQPHVKIERMKIDHPPVTPLIQRPLPQPIPPIQRMEVDEPSSETYRAPLRSEPTTPNSSFKRSHSSPNLQKFVEEGRKSLIPQIDRSSKPQIPENNIRVPVLSSQDREERMQPVYGNNHPGITGLKNLGNSCYMNSIIQCLSNTCILANYFNGNTYSNDLNKKNEKSVTGYVAEEVAQVIKALWRGQYKSISPRDLKVVVGQYKFQFESCEQQDSHEFLTFLLDWMHNDLKQADKMPYPRELTIAEKEWEKSLEGQNSIVSKLFFGQSRSTIQCTTCLQTSTTYETFNSLTMSLPAQNKCTLDDCVKKYVSGQKVSGWKCPNCKRERDGVKKFDLAKLPLIIIIHLNRFGDSGGWLEKKNTAVDFPLTGFDLQPYVVSDAENNSPSSVYNLYAMSNHYGTMDGGHYTAYCKSATQRKWYKYDDHTVNEVPQSQVKSQSTSAYLLFYASVPAEKMIMHT